MRVLKSATISLLLLFIAQSAAMATDIKDRDQALDMFKKYVNNMVQRVEKAKDPNDKRAIINNSFDNMVTVFDKVLTMGIISETDKEAVLSLKGNIVEKKNELTGSDGYKRVPNSELNNFANYVQQDLEQADTVTISISVTLLIVILVLLLVL